MSPPPSEPLVRKVDAIQIGVPDLEAGLAFYRDRLGHQLIWRTEQAAGLRLPDTDTELVLQTEREGPEINLLVDSADQAAQRVVQAGGTIVVPPFDIQIGRCVVVRDPWGTALVLLDTSKGLLITDAEGNVIGNRPAYQNMNIPLQPLRIPAGWLIEYNNGLYECDPLPESIAAEARPWLFKEDMLQIKHLRRNRLLDLGWYPEGDLVAGAFTVVVYEGDFRGALLHEFRSADRQIIVAEIERLLAAICNDEL
jgi:predicted enzyme related to lactoylglutathione lyase